MERPLTTPKLMLVADERVPTDHSVSEPVRRFRLARVRFDAPPAQPADRFEHLKRVFD